MCDKKIKENQHHGFPEVFYPVCLFVKQSGKKLLWKLLTIRKLNSILFGWFLTSFTLAFMFLNDEKSVELKQNCYSVNDTKLSVISISKQEFKIRKNFHLSRTSQQEERQAVTNNHKHHSKWRKENRATYGIAEFFHRSLIYEQMLYKVFIIFSTASCLFRDSCQ